MSLETRAWDSASGRNASTLFNPKEAAQNGQMGNVCMCPQAIVFMTNQRLLCGMQGPKSVSCDRVLRFGKFSCMQRNY